MTETNTKMPVKIEKTSPATPQSWRPFESLRREVDRLFDDFSGGVWQFPFGRSFFNIEPFRRAEAVFGAVPAVDVTETDKGYDITAELPGMGEKNIEVTVANGVLTIKGEKQDEKEEKKKDYYIRERSFGSFVRAFQVPDGVDTDKIEAKAVPGLFESVGFPAGSE